MGVLQENRFEAGERERPPRWVEHPVATTVILALLLTVLLATAWLAEPAAGPAAGSGALT